MSRVNAVLLAMILVLAAGLRWYGIDTHGFWTDEFCSMSDAMGWGLQLDQAPLDQPIPPLPVCTKLSSARPISKIVPAIAATDVHPPVYFFLLRLWVDCFGDSEKAARSMGTVIACAGIVAIYFAASATAGPAAALRAALLAAVAVPWIEFSQEVRNYLLATTLVALTAWSLIRLGRNPTISATVAFTAGLLLLPLTHYYAAVSAAVMVLYGLVAFPVPARKRVLVAAGMSGLLFVSIWGPSVLNQLHHLSAHDYWLTDDGPGRGGRWLERIARLPVRYIVDTEMFGLPSAASAIVGGLILAALPVVFVLRPDLRLWVLLAVAPIVQLAVLDLIEHKAALSWVRYSLTATPGFLIVIASVFRVGRWSFVPTAVAAAAALLSLQTAYTPLWKVSDLQAWVVFAGRTLGPADGLVITGPDPIRSSIDYAGFQHYSPTTPGLTMILTGPASGPTLDRLRRCDHILVVSEWPDRTPRLLMPGFVADSSQASGHELTLYRGRIAEIPNGVTR